MTEKEKAVKIFLVILCVSVALIPSIMLYFSMKEINTLKEAINVYKTQADNENVELQKETNFPSLDYNYGDDQYGSWGKALSGTYEDMVVDWREDPVYRPKEKTAYLTFDDGPSHFTPEILDILDKYNVKATFFVIGGKNDEEKKCYKEIVDRGHSLGLHSQSHKYSYIYKSLDNFLEDYNALFTEVSEITGEVPVLFRFPGGSNNPRIIENIDFNLIKDEIDSRGFIYHDWNVSGEDAVYKYISPDDIESNVLKGAKDKNFAVVLLHDTSTKKTTLEALPGIIEGLQEEGFVLDKITPSVKPIHFK